MLLQLNIKNFALIETLSLNFEVGFNVLTGETGAGKSILIDAINYVLGSKFNKDLIRTGEKSTYVEAIFTVETDTTKNILNSLEIEYDDTVIIARESFNTGRTIIKINGKSVILSTLRLVSDTLLDIHGQHENVHLLDSGTHIRYLDDFCGEELTDIMKSYSKKYDKVTDINNKIKELEGKDTDSDKISNFIQFQIEEINNAKLKINEDIELEERATILTNSEKISNCLNKTYQWLYNGSDEIAPIHSSLDNVIKELRTIESKVKVVKEIADSLEEAYYNVEQNISELRAIKDNFYYDMDELSDINNRIYEISKLKKKYGSSIEEILKYKESLEDQYNEIVNKNEILLKLNKEKSQLEAECFHLSKGIHDIRNKYAVLLEEKVMNELSYIGMGKSKLKVDVVLEDVLKSNGSNKVQFLISTNPGEPLKALDKIASGGELSRIMLSLKTVFIHKDMIPTVIFDEIDTGISGLIAQRVAEKMYHISNSHQVFCITHLPQLATMSDNHYKVFKEVNNDKTFTSVKQLSSSEKVEEISRMISGVELTDITISNAKQLIEMANKLKKEIHN